MPEPDFRVPEPPTLRAHRTIAEQLATPLVEPNPPTHGFTPDDNAYSRPEALDMLSAQPFAGLHLARFNQWHFLRDLPEAYQRDVRAKVADTMLYAPWSLQALFVRQGTFTLCALRSLAGSGLADVDPVAYGMAKRNMRVATRPGKRPERESAQAGQRAALGRAVDAWLRGKLAWTRPRHKEA